VKESTLFLFGKVWNLSGLDSIGLCASGSPAGDVGFSARVRRDSRCQFWQKINVKRIRTAAQEESLRKLLTGNHLEREQVISIHPPEMRLKIRKFIKVRGDTDKLFDILLSDLARAGRMVREKADDQFLRRMTIRCFAAAVDGIIYGLKQTALASAEFSGRTFSDNELILLREEAIEPKGKRPPIPAFQKNIKQTFTLIAKAYGISCPTNFDQDGFSALCETYNLRNRLMHPKSFMTIGVTDEEKQRCSDAAAWLNLELNRLFETCRNS
jgi:hypothetical protein